MVTRGAWHRKDAGVNISRASIDLMGTYTFLFSFSGTGNAQGIFHSKACFSTLVMASQSERAVAKKTLHGAIFERRLSDE